ncbi:MAG: signal transduction histidine kinase [Pirellulaceae bacterium]|jgi:signal transduction histidine kinase
MASAELKDPKQLELENAQLRRQLREAQKMTALGELVSTTTHEFNNVLMTILNYAKMGIRNKDEATRDKALDKIMAAGERAAKITNAVLGMARNRTDDMLPTDLASLINESLFLLEREMHKYRIQVEKVYDEDLPKVTANGNQIQQVLLNLLTNARQAIGERGHVVIGLKADPANNMVDMSVRDSGAGISQEKLRQIFTPFFSTKDGPDESGKGGTGLGLSACRDIVNSHNGRIRVESTVGKGTCFTIKLPIAKKLAPARAPIVLPLTNAQPAPNMLAND